MTLLARMVLNGDMTMGLFDKLKLAIEYAGNISELEIKDSRIVALVDWIKNGGLDSDWYIEASDCPTCKTRSICIRGFGDSQYVLCPSMSCGVERTGSAAQ